MGTRLRYMGHNLEVPEGNFVIGRSSSCQLSLDDALVSRRHAVLTVGKEGAYVEDLGSRNGVIVNGQRIVGQRYLQDGDTITIGQQNMIILGVESKGGAPRPAQRRAGLFETMSASEMLPDEPTVTSSHVTMEQEFPDKRVNELSLIGAVADKAFSMGRGDDALRLLERPLAELLERAKKHGAGGTPPQVDDLAARRAISLALKLAQSTQDGAWIDYTFDLGAARGELLPAANVDELYGLVRRIRIDLGALRAYVEVLRRTTKALGPNEKFLVSRIEGLEPVASLK